MQSFNALWSDEVKAAGTSRVTWEIIPVGDSCQLTVIHDQLPEGANPELYGGWPMILSGLKTLLETGERLTTPGSLLYACRVVPSLGRSAEAPPGGAILAWRCLKTPGDDVPARDGGLQPW